MDPRLLRYYNQELQHVRDMGAEFARDFPKIAGRLGMEGLECADPYVERLLEGFAFLAARVYLKIDDEFPDIVESLLTILYPHYLRPIPSASKRQFPANRLSVSKFQTLPKRPSVSLPFSLHLNINNPTSPSLSLSAKASPASHISATWPKHHTCLSPARPVRVSQ